MYIAVCVGDQFATNTLQEQDPTKTCILRTSRIMEIGDPSKSGLRVSFTVFRPFSPCFSAVFLSATVEPITCAVIHSNELLP